MKKTGSISILVLAALALVSGCVRAATEYSFLMMEQPAGSQTVSQEGNRYNVTFEFNDRGRGPKIASAITVDRDGFPVHVENSGVNYLKVPISETFDVSSGKARWKNSSEEGEKAFSPKAFYLSLSGVPNEGTLLANVLLRAKDGRVPLFPEGEASIEKGRELVLAAPGGGGQKTIVEYFISGFDFTPSPLWLDSDGNLFASVNGWSQIVLKGWEKSVPEILKAQEADSEKRMAARERALRHPLTGPLAITHVSLFDSETATVRPDTTVIVEGNRIRTVGDSRDTPVPEGATVVNGRGKTLVPGLWDMHVHLSGDTDGILDIAAGVTSVRDLANDIDHLLEWKRKFDSGETVGPRVLMAGFLDGRGPYAGPTKVFADSEDEARVAIEKYAKLGYCQIKIYSSIKPELVPAIARMAHEKGMRVSGHVPAFMTAEQFVRDGADEIQHVNFLFLNFLFDTVKDTRTPARFVEVAEHAATFDFSSEKFKAFVELLKTRKTVSDPTLDVFEDMFLGRPTTESPSLAPIAGRLPAQIRRGLFNTGLPMTEGKEKLYRDSFQALLRMVSELYRAGVPIVAGTDSLAGFALHRELELYVAAGIPTPKVLQLATLGAARVMGRDKELGSVSAGKLADFLLVDGDPVASIGDIRRVSSVYKDGVRFDPAELDASIGVKP
jgi:cytosine/adenosine deaminase-related metal-dependent hydrolase